MLWALQLRGWFGNVHVICALRSVPCLTVLILCSYLRELSLSGGLPSGFQVAMGNERQWSRGRQGELPGCCFLSISESCTSGLASGGSLSLHWPQLLGSGSSTFPLCPLTPQGGNSLLLLLISESLHHSLFAFFPSPITNILC